MSDERNRNIDHQWVQNNIPLWADPDDDSLSDIEQQQIEHHLESCEACHNLGFQLKMAFGEANPVNQRESLPRLTLNKEASWQRIQHKMEHVDATNIAEDDTLKRVWRQAAVWLIAGLLTGGLVSTQWNATMLDGLESKVESTEETTEWDTLAEAVNQEWITTSPDWSDVNSHNSEAESSLKE